MKNKIFLVIFVFICLFSFSKPVSAACTGQSGKVSILSNSLLDRIKVMSYRQLGAMSDSVGSYGLSVFSLELDDRRGTYYYAYGIDPGYKFASGQVCCNALSNGRFNRGVRAGFTYLITEAGRINRTKGSASEEAAVMDMAIKIFSMANGIANTCNTNTGSSFYQLTTYLRLVTDL